MAEADIASADEPVAVDQEPVTADPVVVVPIDLVLDDVSRDRLVRQLAAAPAHIQAVIAPTAPVPTGSSSRVHAQRLSLTAPAGTQEIVTAEAQGAVALRAGVAFEVHPDHVTFETAAVLVDPGGVTHDPWIAPSPGSVVDPAGRPPFPRRPVTLFLGLDDDLATADHARQLVNNLLRVEVEARLAVTARPEGLNLSGPCPPTRATVEALVPDVIVALDPTALAAVPDWCTSRATILVELTDDTVHDVELVSWRLGESSGRLRARIGRQVSARTVEDLLNRLCSGPQPVPPSDREVTLSSEIKVALRSLHRPAPSGPQVEVVSVATGSPRSGASLLDGLVDHLTPDARIAERAPFDRLRHPLSPDLLLVAARTPITGEITRIIAERRRAGGATVVVIDEDDLDGGPGPGALTVADRVVLTPAAISLVQAAGLVLVPDRTLLDAVRALGAAAMVVPTMVTRGEVNTWRPLSKARLTERPSVATFGWWVGTTDEAELPGFTNQVSAGLLEVLEAHPDARCDIVCPPSFRPRAFLGHERVVVHHGEPTPAQRARWLVQVWTPATRAFSEHRDLRPVVAAGLAGTPTLLATDDAVDGGSLIDATLVITRVRKPDAWAGAVSALLDDDEHLAARSEHTSRVTDALAGKDASALVTKRIVGWVNRARSARRAP